MINRRGIRILIYVLLLMAFLGAGFSAGVFVDRILIPPLVASASADEPSSGLDLIDQAYQVIQQNYVDRSALDQTKLEYSAISGMVEALGDTGHSRFLSPEMVKEQRTFTRGSFEGIGAEVTEKDGRVIIVTPMDGSPAQAAGVRPGDIIVRVDGVDMRDLSITEVISKVLGPAGSKVTLTLEDPKTGEVRDVVITRAKINLNNVTWEMLPGTSLAHLKLSAFSHGVTRQLQAALEQIQQEEATGIVLDLRNNPGGLLDEAVGVTSQFLGSGNVLLVRDAQGKQQALAVEPGGMALKIPMVVLINQGTASAAEIVSGAIQDAGRAILVGETTFGTGTVLNTFGLNDGSELLLATQEWLTPQGRVIWHKGITPDMNVTLPDDVSPILPSALKAMTAAELKSSPDTQLLKAIEILSQAGK
jgi:carboxyl-terminal processing protease